MTRSPNTLVLMSDQHNPRYLGAAGHPLVKTPNLDRLAERSTRFRRAYTPSPICVPARASFATGLHVHEVGYWDNALAYDGRVRSWGHELQKSGRPVESIGKLHYVDDRQGTGFDRQHLPMHIVDGIGMVWGSVRDPLPRRPGAEKVVTTAGPGWSDYNRYDQRITDLTCDWLAEASTRSEPWTLYVGWVAPHLPIIVPTRWFSLYDLDAILPAKLRPADGHKRHPWVEAYASCLVGLEENTTEHQRKVATAAYLGLCSFLDHQVGQVLDTLAAYGLTDSTHVIYTSDHGDTVGTRGLWGKTVLYEESAGIPMLLSGPGVEPGRVSDTPVNLIDLHPTILESAGLQPDRTRPGQSLLGITRATENPERVTLSQYHAYAVPSAGYLLRRGRYKLHHYVGFEPELFDLISDPEEASDLSSDGRYTGVLAELEAELAAILYPETPESIDAKAKAAQAELIERHGGKQRASLIGAPAATPVPDAHNLRGAFCENGQERRSELVT